MNQRLKLKGLRTGFVSPRSAGDLKMLLSLFILFACTLTMLCYVPFDQE